MSGNGREGGTTGGGSVISAAAVSVGYLETRYLTPERQPRRWGVCFGKFSCFGSQKGGKRIVPASRLPDGNGPATRGNVPQPIGPSNMNANLNISLLAPPSSPASFTNSTLPSTVQSPTCFLSMSNSPGGPSSTMFATGPYAHETQLVSPPVFSTYTTEPSTAPLTPPPELAHLTTPSSPDVPFAHFLSSSLRLKSAGKTNSASYYGYIGCDLQSNYPLYPGSPNSSLISPASGTPRTGLSSPYPEGDNPSQWHELQPPRNGGPSKLFGLDSAASRNFMLSSDSSFFRPNTAAHFNLDQGQQSFSLHSHCGARISVSREGDGYPGGGNRPSKSAVMQDPEEIEAYRASFGFSADEIIPATSYTELNDGIDVSFAMPHIGNCKSCVEHHPFLELSTGWQKSTLMDPGSPKMPTYLFKEDASFVRNYDGSVAAEKREAAALSKSASRKFRVMESCSDAEIEYRRARSVKDANSAALASLNSPS